MSIIDLPQLECPPLQRYRSLRTIECRRGVLGLCVDFTELPNANGYAVTVSYYSPITSGNYHNAYILKDVLITNQVDSLIKETLLSIINESKVFDEVKWLYITDSMIVVENGDLKKALRCLNLIRD